MSVSGVLQDPEKSECCRDRDAEITGDDGGRVVMHEHTLAALVSKPRVKLTRFHGVGVHFFNAPRPHYSLLMTARSQFVT